MKKERYKVVIAGFAHVHINDVAAHFFENSRIHLSACADTVPLVNELKSGPYTRAWNLDFCSDRFQLKVYEDWLTMLEQERPDLCVVNSENAYHTRIAEACAQRGIDVCLEKPMAVSLGEGLAMYRAAQTYGTEIIVNWPITWNPGMRTIKRLLDEHIIGDIIEVKTRMGHTGPLGSGAKHRGVTQTAEPMSEAEKARTWWHQHACGGGAMADYCCYGGLLAFWYVGEPAVAAIGMRINSITTMGDAEDNAAMFVRFRNCYAVVEGTWTTYDHTFHSPIVYGTKGSIVGDYKTGNVAVYNTDGTIVPIQNEPLPVGQEDVAAQYVYHKDTGTPLHLTSQIEFNLDALALLDVGIRSSNSGKMELVNNLHWQIG